MRKLYILLILVVTCSFLSQAQNRQERRQQREEMRREFLDFKMKFIAQEMELKGEEQQKFFELYENLEGERMKIFRETRAIEKKVKKNPNATEADYEALNKTLDDARERSRQLEKKYEGQFSAFLTEKQLYKMRDAEEKFRKKMHEMRSKKNEKR